MYVAITFIMPFGVQQLQRVAVCKGSWECKGQICNLCPTWFMCSEVLTLTELTQAVAGMSHDMFLSPDKYHNTNNVYAINWA